MGSFTEYRRMNCSKYRGQWGLCVVEAEAQHDVALDSHPHRNTHHRLKPYQVIPKCFLASYLVSRSISSSPAASFK